MTKYLNDAAFTVGMPTGQRFRDNWDRIFKKTEKTDEVEFSSAEPAVAVPQEAPEDKG